VTAAWSRLNWSASAARSAGCADARRRRGDRRPTWHPVDGGSSPRRSARSRLHEQFHVAALVRAGDVDRAQPRLAPSRSSAGQAGTGCRPRPRPDRRTLVDRVQLHEVHSSRGSLDSTLARPRGDRPLHTRTAGHVAGARPVASGTAEDAHLAGGHGQAQGPHGALTLVAACVRPRDSSPSAARSVRRADARGRDVGPSSGDSLTPEPVRPGTRRSARQRVLARTEGSVAVARARLSHPPGWQRPLEPAPTRPASVLVPPVGYRMVQLGRMVLFMPSDRLNRDPLDLQRELEGAVERNEFGVEYSPSSTSRVAPSRPWRRSSAGATRC